MSERDEQPSPVDPGRAGPAPRESGARARRPSSTADFLRAAALVGAATAAGWLAQPRLAQADLAMLYLVAVAITATRSGRGPSVLAAALSVAAFDFFFVPPFFTFAVHELRHLLTFATMFAAGLLISALTLRIRRAEQASRDREQRTAALYALSRELGAAVDAREVAAVLARQTTDVFRCGAAVLLSGEAGALAVVSRTPGAPDDLRAGAATTFPLSSGVHDLGVLALAVPPGAPLDPDERETLLAFARQASVALSRARLADEAKAAALRARTEEIRSSLLSAVSHDLRTPLASITGAATTLRDGAASLPDRDRADLLDTLCEEAERMERLVRNLLEMTRIEAGGVEPSREWVPLEEIVGAAFERVSAKLAGRAVTTTLPADLPLCRVDPQLVEHALLNLLENAAKHTPRGSPVELLARRDGDDVVIEVLDRGPGFPPGAEVRAFEKFYRGPSREASGAGLGLAIVKGVAEAHGGSASAANREGGGARLTLRLPLGGAPPSMLPDAPSSSPPSPPTASVP